MADAELAKNATCHPRMPAVAIASLPNKRNLDVKVEDAPA
jgi:hypothetical protein